MKILQDVIRLNEHIGITRSSNVPHLPSKENALFRAEVLREEANEYFDAYLRADLAGMVDALIDSMIFALGGIWQMGAERVFDECWDIVMDCNMRKIKGDKGRGTQNDMVKPEGWLPPENKIAQRLQKITQRLVCETKAKEFAEVLAVYNGDDKKSTEDILYRLIVHRNPIEGDWK